MVVNGHVTRPAGGKLTVSEVAVLLGVSKRTDNKYHLKDICTSGSINIWSQYKPVRKTVKAANLTLADMQAANYGFNINSILVNASTLSSLGPMVANKCIDALGSWDGIYAPPRGRITPAAAEWYRLLDFNGYFHYAAEPYIPISPSGSIQTISGIRVFKNDDADASPIALEDMTGIPSQGRSIGQWRLGAIAKRGSTYTPAVVHAQDLEHCWVDTGDGIYADLPNLTAPTPGTWQVCVFLTDYDPSDEPGTGRIYGAFFFPGGYASVYIPIPGPTPEPPSSLPVWPGELEFTPRYDQVDGDLIYLDVFVPFETNQADYEPEVTLHAALLRYDDYDAAWVEVASDVDTADIISAGDGCEVVLDNHFSYPATELYLDMWYQVDGDQKYYVMTNAGKVYEANTAAQRDQLLASLRLDPVSVILANEDDA